MLSTRLIIVFFAFGLIACQDGGAVTDPSPKPLPDVPHIYINTTANQPIATKDTYVTGTVKIVGSEGYNDYTGLTQVRLRGNSTLGGPKFSYRLKLDQGAELLGLSSNKDWVLLANWIDQTLLTNAVAMQVGHLLQMPYTNHIIPVDVTVNGNYKGSYMFTEQIEEGKNRINIADGGQLLEFDQYMGEDWQFYDQHLGLPMIVHYPKLTSNAELATIQSEFEMLSALVASPEFPNNEYRNLIDEDALINYLIAMLLTDNEEINHPKSTFMYKPKNGKYQMGPLWDFDWGFGFESSGAHIERYNSPLFWTPYSNYTGTQFFYKFLKDPAIKAKLLQRWNDFKLTQMPELVLFVQNYGSTIEKTYSRDHVRWSNLQPGRPANPPDSKMVNWLNNRAVFIDQYVINF